MANTGRELFTVRELNYETDLKQIETLFQKHHSERINEDLFVWKHMKNPFGKSFGLVAIDKDEIIAVCMFMQWEFISANKVIKAIRSNDSVTNEQYQGKGIFKDLSLKALEYYKESHEFYYGVPNKNSGPRQVKFGWKYKDNIDDLKLGIVSPFQKSINLSISSANQNDYSNLKASVDFSTNKTEAYFKWRYADSRYKFASFGDGNFIVYEIKKWKALRMIMIYDIMGNADLFSTMIASLSKKIKIFLVYYSDNIDFKKVKFIKTFKRKKPPILIHNDHKNIQSLLQFSLGEIDSII